MKITIDNINWPGLNGYDDSIKNDLIDMWSKEFTNKYKVKSKIVSTLDGIEFLPTDVKGGKEYLFTSLVYNHQPIKSTSAQAKKLGRNYTKSYRLTKEQWEGVTTFLIGTLDKLKLHVNIKMSTTTEVVIVRTKDQNFTWPLPGKYTKGAT